MTNLLRRLFRLFKPAPIVWPKEEWLNHPRHGEIIRLTYEDGRVQEVCAQCRGNCGQCGTSIGRGIQPSMQAMVDYLHGKRGPA